MNNKIRPELMIGILLAGIWLLLKVMPRGGIIMTLLLIAAAVLVVLGLVPGNLYNQAKAKLRQLLGKK